MQSNQPRCVLPASRPQAEARVGEGGRRPREKGRSRRVTASGGGAFRGDDLVGRLAGQFRHVVELVGEAADPGGGRSHLDDEVADLRFRHHGAHHVPAFPALAGVEAEDLAAASRQDGVDLGGGVRRADDLDGVDRLQQHRLALRQRLGDADAAGDAERHVGGIDAVIGAVDQRHRDVDDGKSQRAVLERVDHAFLDRGDVVARHHAAGDLLLEHEAGAARHRLDVEHDVAELAVAARLLLVAAALR